MSMRIKQVTAMEVLDSRGNPTLEACVALVDCMHAPAIVLWAYQDRLGLPRRAHGEVQSIAAH